MLDATRTSRCELDSRIKSLFYMSGTDANVSDMSASFIIINSATLLYIGNHKEKRPRNRAAACWNIVFRNHISIEADRMQRNPPPTVQIAKNP
jgi:hypothetical protein